MTNTLLWMTLLACGDKTTDTADDTNTAEDTGNTGDTSDTEDTTDTEDTEENTEDTGPRPPIRPFCKMLSYTDSWNGEVSNQATYAWNGLTQTSDTSTATFNEYGYQTNSETEYEGWLVLTEATYECDGWCKMLSTTSSQGYDTSSLEVSETLYDWTDNKQSQGDSRYWVYNDMGYVIEMHDEGDGFSNTSFYDYDCGEVWCKLVKITTQNTSNGETDELFTSYSWEGNTQLAPNGSTEYNDYGYITHRTTESSVGTSEQFYTYDCGE